jgi:hypothetical protein
MPDINPEKVCHLIVKAREFDVQEGEVLEDDGSNPADERFRGVLADSADDPTRAEIKAFVEVLDFDERCEIVALLWIGRGDFDQTEWEDALQLAQSRDDPRTIADYLLGIPLLADYLEEGLAAFDINCAEFERAHL